jgi:hypothetical protein
LQAIRSQSEIKDASNSLKYTYSIYDNSKYYQLAGYFEDTSDLQMYNQQAYATGIRPRVEGNYSYDPTLPSLLITPSSYTS